MADKLKTAVLAFFGDRMNLKRAGMTVFGVFVCLILAAIHDHAPNRTDTERIIGTSVFGGRIIGDVFGVGAARIVVAA